MGSPDFFHAIAEHVEYFGYVTKLDEDGIFKTTQVPPGHPSFWIVPHPRGGAVFRALYRVGPNAKSDSEGFLKFLNEANSLAAVSRFIGFENFMIVEAWFPPYYERQAFGIFFNRYLMDIATPADRNPSAVARFFPADTGTTATQNPANAVHP